MHIVFKLLKKPWLLNIPQRFIRQVKQQLIGRPVLPLEQIC